MTSPTQRAGADDPKALLVRTSINLAKTVEALQSENAALQARIAELGARNAASERDAVRALPERWRGVADASDEDDRRDGRSSMSPSARCMLRDCADELEEAMKDGR